MKSKIKIGDRVRVNIDGKDYGCATIKRISHIITNIMLIKFDDSWDMLVHESSLSEVK